MVFETDLLLIKLYYNRLDVSIIVLPIFHKYIKKL